MIRWLFLIVVLVSGTQYLFADVPEEQGDPRQLYSAWTTKPPKINGCVTDATNPFGSQAPGTDNDEWDDAYARVVTLNDGSTVTLLLKNDADYLYVAVIYTLASNNSANNRVTLYFDQGVGGGENDDQLTLNNENMVSSNRASTAAWAPWDRFWDGSSWVDDTSGIDFEVAEGYYNDIYQWEFAIPLNNGNSDDLSVNGGNGVVSGDELGFLLEVYKEGLGTFYWAATNMDPNDSSSGNGWGEIRLGKPREFLILSATVAANGNPIVDGVIDDDAYRGCYQRDIVLTNHKGAVIPARIYILHDTTANDIYIAVKVFDSTQNSSDYFQVYFEQTNPGPTSLRDYILQTNQENALRVDGGGNVTDWYFNDLGGGGPGTWSDDSSAGDPVDGDAAVSYSATEGCWHFEFRVPHNFGTQTYDLDQVLDDALIGFLVRYYDADKPAGEQDFWWDLAVNTDCEYLDNINDINFAIGWAYLQLGAPYLQIVHPDDKIVVEGTYPIDAWVKASGSALVVNVDYQIEGSNVWTPLTRVASTNYWATNWDTTTVSDGTYELRVRATDSNGLQTTQIITVTVNNAGAAAAAPTVSITSPSSGSSVHNIVTITFNIDPEPGLDITDVEISIDGADWVNVTGFPTSSGNWDDGYHNWNTNNVLNGSHIFRIRARDSNGRWGYSDIHLVVVSNKVLVSITSPSAGDVVSGVVTVTFNIDPEPNEEIVSTQISIDGGAWTDVSSAPTSGGGWDDGSHVWDTLSYVNGSHTIQVRARDSNGRWGYSEIRLVIVDNRGPIIVDVKVHYPLGKVWASCGDYILITARVYDDGAGLDTTSIIADATAIDGTTHSMVDDGTNGDEVAGDGVYTCKVKVGVTGNERVAFTIEARDRLGNVSTPARGWVDVRNQVRAKGGGCFLTNGVGPMRPQDFVGWLMPFLMVFVFAMLKKRRELLLRLMRAATISAFPAILFLFFLFVPAFSAAQDRTVSTTEHRTLLVSPMMMKSNDFLHALLFVPPLESPTPLSEGRLIFRFGTRYSRISLSDLNGTSNIETDVGFNESYFYIAYGMTPKLELRGFITYAAWSGTLEMVYNSQSIFEAGEIGGGPGSSWVGVKYLVYTSEEKRLDMAFAGGVKLPNGSGRNYLSTDAPDFSLWFLIGKEFSLRFRFFGELGFTLVGKPKIFRKHADFTFKHFVSFGLGISYLPKRHLAFLAQIQGNTNAMGVALEGCDSPPVSLFLGMRCYISKAVFFEGGVGTGVTDAASEFIFSISFIISEI